MITNTWLRGGIPFGTAPCCANMLPVNPSRHRTSAFFVIGVFSSEFIDLQLRDPALRKHSPAPPCLRNRRSKTTIPGGGCKEASRNLLSDGNNRVNVALIWWVC